MFDLSAYEAQLKVTGGAIAEFVNPKYKNAEQYAISSGSFRNIAERCESAG